MKGEKRYTGGKTEDGQPNRVTRAFSFEIGISVFDDQERKIDERMDDEQDRTGCFGKPDVVGSDILSPHAALTPFAFNNRWLFPPGSVENLKPCCRDPSVSRLHWHLMHSMA